MIAMLAVGLTFAVVSLTGMPFRGRYDDMISDGPFLPLDNVNAEIEKILMEEYCPTCGGKRQGVTMRCVHCGVEANKQEVGPW